MLINPYRYPATSSALTYEVNTFVSELAGVASPYELTGVDVGTAAADRRLIIPVVSFVQNQGYTASLTVNGNAATRIGAVSASNSFPAMDLFYYDLAAGTTANIEGTTDDGDGYFRLVTQVISVYGSIASMASADYPEAESTTTGASLDLDVESGDLILGVAANRDGGDWSWSGLTAEANEEMEANDKFCIGIHEATSTESPRDIEATPNVLSDIVARSLRIRPS